MQFADEFSDQAAVRGLVKSITEGACAACYTFGRLHREATLVGQRRAVAHG